MKKVLSLVLALTLVLGMSTVAFAAIGDATGGSDNITVSQFEVELGTSVTFDVTLSSTVIEGAGGNPAANGWTVPAASMDYTSLALPATGVSISAKATASGGQKFRFTVTATNANANIGDYSGVIEFGNSGAGLTPAMIDIDFSVVEETGTGDAVITGSKIIGIRDEWASYLDWTLGDFNPNSNDNVTGDMVAKSYLTAEMFVWGDKDGNQLSVQPTTGLRSNHLTQSSNKIDVRKTNPTNNSGTIKEVVIDGITLKVKTVKYFLKCGETDVSFDLALTYKSSAVSTKYGASFTISNSKEYIDEGQTEVDTDDHIYLEADASVRNLEMYIGENLYLTKSFGKGQKAYARVDLELSAGGEALFQKFPELSDVYTLYTVGVSSAGVTAWFDIPDTLFVYDENYKLVGTTADTKLPFSNTYYLTTKKVDLGGSAVEGPAETDESSTTPAETDNAGTGGGTVTAPSNYNPNTGR